MIGLAILMFHSILWAFEEMTICLKHNPTLRVNYFLAPQI